jgi:NAD(P)-dependent dehydrogenase (short-subunit alcohol dehydrogenase family)
MKRDKSFSWRRIGPELIDLNGQKAIVVGGTGGIGRALSRFLAAAGANVVVIGQTFRDAGVAGIEFIQADLSLMREAERISAVLPAETADLVIFTAGIFAAPQRQETAEGIERDLAVSYLNRLVILRNIAPRLGTGRPAGSRKPRVFNMAYPGSGQIGDPTDLNSERSYRPLPAHMNTVAGNEILVLTGARRYPHLNVFGLNPGLIKTNIRDNFLGKGSLKSRLMETVIGLLTPTADAYAQRIAPLLVSPDLETHSGALFDSKGNPILPSEGLSDAHMKTFVAVSEALLARAGILLGT